jgi:hypothetical protein
MVPTACAAPSSAWAGLESVTVKVSSSSAAVSPFTATAIVLAVSPGANETVPPPAP